MPKTPKWMAILRERTILLLVGLFAASTATVIWNVIRVQNELVEETARGDAASYASVFLSLRALYTSEVVDRMKDVGIHASHDYKNDPHAIPLPATLTMLLGKEIGIRHPGAAADLYSPYPFPWRKDSGGLRDTFAQKAWLALSSNGEAAYEAIENIEGVPTFRYATPDRMSRGCIGCHNTRPDSPKRDWKEGDVRGVIEVRLPLSHVVRLSQIEAFKSMLGVFVTLLPGALAVVIVVRRLQRERKQFEGKAKILDEQNVHLSALATRDPLTNALNRRGLEACIRTLNRDDACIAVLADADDFKSANTQFGHAFGDLVLKEISARLTTAFRPTDWVARIGGDEFLVVVRGLSLPVAVVVADRARKSISETPIRFGGVDRHASVSIGVAAFAAAPQSLEEILVATRAALDRSKTLGKDMVSTTE